MNTKLVMLCGILSTSSMVYAADGEIEFIGKVLDSTCTLGGTAGNYTVTLPTVGKTALSAVGATAGDTVFNISLTNCPVSTGISIFFDNTWSDILSSGRLKNSAASNAAGNVEIQLLNSSGIVLNLKEGTALTQNSTKLANTTADSAVTLPFKARYYATAPVVIGGDVKSKAVYTVIYE